MEKYYLFTNGMKHIRCGLGRNMIAVWRVQLVFHMGELIVPTELKN